MMSAAAESDFPKTDLPTINSLASLAGVTANAAGPHVGDVVWWSLADADIERKTLEEGWSAAGLDVKMLPEVPTPERALRAAVRGQHGLTNTLVRCSYEGADKIVYVVVHENKTADADTSYSQKAKLVLDRATGTLTVGGQHEAVPAIQAEFVRLLGTHTARDVMNTIVKTLRSWAAVSLRDTGGVYWVPTTRAASLQALRTCIEKIGKSRVYLLPVHGSPDASLALGAATTGSIEAELSELQIEIDKFVTEGARASTLSRRLEAFTALRARADLYREILGVTVQDLDAKLAGMESAVQIMLAAQEAV